MVQSEDEQLFRGLKSAAVAKPYRSNAFRHFVMMKYARLNGGRANSASVDVYRIFKNQESTDLLAVAISHAGYAEMKDNPNWVRAQVIPALSNLFDYVEHLENRIKHLEDFVQNQNEKPDL